MHLESDTVELAPRFFFTEPWEPISVRRGDALGLRALTDLLAEAVAPELSNRIRDGRWVTILAWCHVRLLFCRISTFSMAGNSRV